MAEEIGGRIVGGLTCEECAEVARNAALEAELTQARADNAKLETLWENAVAARDKLSEELTRARAERDDAREALKEGYKAAESAKDLTEFIADLRCCAIVSTTDDQAHIALKVIEKVLWPDKK